MNKIFVGGLSWNTIAHDLEKHFSQVGEVTEAKVISDRETGKSRGFGFVSFAADSHASSAVERFDGQELDGRNIRVSLAEERKPKQDNRNREQNFNSW